MQATANGLKLSRIQDRPNYGYTGANLPISFDVDELHSAPSLHRPNQYGLIDQRANTVVNLLINAVNSPITGIFFLLSIFYHLNPIVIKVQCPQNTTNLYLLSWR